ncbi:FAD-binding protein, partial [Peptostreptococcus porci]
MTKNELYGMLKDIIDENSIFIDESMKKHISFKVGGPADVLVRPKTEDEIKDIFSFLNDNNIPFLVKGNGSNILIKDGGFRGVVIEIADNFSSFEIVGDDMIIQTGALLSSIGRAAME